VDGNAVYFPDWAATCSPSRKKRPSHLVSQDRRVQRCSRIRLSRQSRSPWRSRDRRRHPQLRPTARRRERDLGAPPNRKAAMDHEGDPHPAAVITGSPVVFQGVVTSASLRSRNRDGGSGVSLLYVPRQHGGARRGERRDPLADLHRPRERRQAGGYSGNAIWQPPAIDPKRGSLFAGTGNNYTAPPEVEACHDANPLAECAAPDDFFDTALALDLKTGKIKWRRDCKVWTCSTLRVCFRLDRRRTAPPRQPGLRS